MGQNEANAASRFFQPSQTASERLEELLAWIPEQQQQAQWLAQLLHERWPTPLPQPFIGFDEEEQGFVLEWQAYLESHALYINASDRTGAYCRYSSGQPVEDPLPELDLNADETWQFLRNALATTWA